jgi:hypothetical protein
VEPYRALNSTRSPESSRRSGTSDLVLPFAILWVVSLFRLVTALVSGRTFGTIDTLALAALILLPLALARGRRPMR